MQMSIDEAISTRVRLARIPATFSLLWLNTLQEGWRGVQNEEVSGDVCVLSVIYG